MRDRLNRHFAIEGIKFSVVMAILTFIMLVSQIVLTGHI